MIPIIPNSKPVSEQPVGTTSVLVTAILQTEQDVINNEAEEEEILNSIIRERYGNQGKSKVKEAQ